MTERERLRTVDLARLAGVSTQQIRNYEDAGLLPDVPRTESGYRVFGEAHRRALLTYRALAAGCGALVAQDVMRAVRAGDVPGALALVDAAHAAAHEQRRALRATSEALTALAAADAPAGAPDDLRIGEVARLVGVRTSALRVWEAAGLITPRRERATGYRVFGPDEVRDARIVRTLRASHYLFPQIAPVLDELRASGGSEALRSAIGERDLALTSRARAMLRAAGELDSYLTFLDDTRSQPTGLRPGPRSSSAGGA
ncbi:MerR family DNA-binding transcriptional regulator [Streptomyces sp. NPDC050400]|uniref:MerR family DNA-binding transcriptional regulator n=1 Tax=Streptomyces sp. NPDC050400 TaxID=3365610 RepID=UPI003797E390